MFATEKEGLVRCKGDSLINASNAAIQRDIKRREFYKCSTTGITTHPEVSGIHAFQIVNEVYKDQCCSRSVLSITSANSVHFSLHS